MLLIDLVIVVVAALIFGAICEWFNKERESEKEEEDEHD